ncbi:MAG: adenylate/guanylate cyclase domain-containing protein, partial [Siculibacillus sp.]|nr:adenylate/guanylate cyclase domain-containing protein [Siculibacillus sp.]
FLGALVAVAVAATLLGATLLAAGFDLLVDPLVPLAALVAGHGTAALVSFSRQRRDAGRIRRRFEQHLAPQVVDLIVRDPSLLRLSGERRVVTALFTDVADFTAMTRRAEPEALVAALDAYFEGMTRIIVAHGGMIDKFVGDAVHAFFNAPVDQPNHAEAAVACAVELVRWSEVARLEPGPRALGFGITRIGIETGEAIVGEIGLGSKLDYTAHGDAVNAAARLEAANKLLGTRIAVGPGTAALVPPGLLRRSGTVELRGLGGDVATFEPVAAVLAPVGEGTGTPGKGRCDGDAPG